MGFTIYRIFDVGFCVGIGFIRFFFFAKVSFVHWFPVLLGCFYDGYCVGIRLILFVCFEN